MNPEQLPGPYSLSSQGSGKWGCDECTLEMCARQHSQALWREGHQGIDTHDIQRH